MWMSTVLLTQWNWLCHGKHLLVQPIVVISTGLYNLLFVALLVFLYIECYAYCHVQLYFLTHGGLSQAALIFLMLHKSRLSVVQIINIRTAVRVHNGHSETQEAFGRNTRWKNHNAQQSKEVPLNCSFTNKAWGAYTQEPKMLYVQWITMGSEQVLLLNSDRRVSSIGT